MSSVDDSWRNFHYCLVSSLNFISTRRRKVEELTKTAPLISKYFLYHVHHNIKHYSIIFAIVLQFDKVMFSECQFSWESNDSNKCKSSNSTFASHPAGMKWQLNISILMKLHRSQCECLEHFQFRMSEGAFSHFSLEKRREKEGSSMMRNNNVTRC